MKKRYKILIAVLAVIIIVQSIGLTFAYKFYREHTIYSPEIHTVENFYKEPYFENPEIIKSLFYNYGVFEFLAMKDVAKPTQMLKRYFNILVSDYYIVDLEVVKDNEKSDSDILIGEPQRINAVLYVPVDEVERVLNKFKNTYQSKDFDIQADMKTFEQFWSMDEYNCELESMYHSTSAYCFYIDTVNDVWGDKDTYVFVSKPSEDGYLYIFLTEDGIGITDVDEWDW